MTIKKKNSAMSALEKISGASLTLGAVLRAIREGEELSLSEFSKKLKITASHLCDIEKGRKTVSPERAARFAKILGRSEKQFVRLSLQDLLNKQEISMIVSVEAA